MNAGARRFVSRQPDESHTLEIEDTDDNATAFFIAVDGTAENLVTGAVDIFVEQVAHLTYISGFVRGGVRRLQIDGGIVHAVIGEGGVDIRLDGQAVSASQLVISTGGSAACPTNGGSDDPPSNGGDNGNGGEPVQDQPTVAGLTAGEAVLVGIVVAVVVTQL